MSSRSTHQRHGILVGVDGSTRSLRAVEWAARTALDSGSSLTICTVYPEPGSALGYPSIIASHERRQRGDEIVRHAAALAHRVTPQVRTDTIVAEGHAAAKIIELAKDRDLVVMGNHGHRWLHRVLAGSVATQVAAHAPCSVAVVHGPARTEGPIVVGVDGSPESQGALDVAFSAADRTQVPVLAIHSYELPTFAVDITSPVMAEVIDFCRNEAHDVLSEALDPWKAKYPNVPVTSECSSGTPGEILTEASKMASLLVVGSRGLGGFRGLMLGSVSHHVVNAAACPVIVARD